MAERYYKTRVGELRPSQVLFSFGVGSMVDLPNISVMVMGLDDWDTNYMTPLNEDRLLAAVRGQLGYQVERLCFPPISQESESWNNPFDESSKIGIPVAPFPRWVRCPQCDLLAPLNFGVFDLKTVPFHPDKTRYVHSNCPKSPSPPTILPARFLTACEKGHLDDFPWNEYVHQGNPCSSPILRLREWGVSGSVSEVEVKCDNCDAKRRMRDAFSEDFSLPCRGRHPHLRDFDVKKCEETMKTILLGASNSWFPITLSALYVPTAISKLEQLVDEHWANLTAVSSKEVLEAFRKTPLLQSFAEYSDDQLWEAIQNKRTASNSEDEQESLGLKIPEWQTFIEPDPDRNTNDFLLKVVAPPIGYENLISKIVLAERLREVRAIIGFTRIDSPGDFDDLGEIPRDRRAPLSRRKPSWVPASEVRGEGIFIQFNEDAVYDWCGKVSERENDFFEAHKQWRRVRNIDNPEAEFPGIRYIMLHSFAHALMRQIALECGYTAASIRERIYSQIPGRELDSMAGILIYTGAADSEGTLGGLVSLGDPIPLGRHINQALEQMRLCASDPLCEEHHPYRDGVTLHGATCHACLFSPETSCERGNKYLDRTTLVRTFSDARISYFDG